MRRVKSQWKRRVSVTMFLLVVFALETSATTGGDSASRMPNLAANDPAQFAWHLFAAVNQPVGEPKSSKAGTYRALWQTWAEQTTVYADPCKAPVWPGPNAESHPGRRSSLVEVMESKIANREVSEDDFDALTGECNLQQVKINRPFFDYVVNHDLWYQEGVIRRASTQGVDLPVEAVIFKADWALISDEDKSRYHWRLVSREDYEQAFCGDQTSTSGRCSSDCVDGLPEGDEPLRLGLTSFHIVTKAIPNWVWTTWNHADTLGRCDYIGCRDDFGSDPSYIPPHREMGKPYPPGTLTPRVRHLLDEAGLPDVWRHYRLMGTQVSFTDTTGRPTRLGSVELEPGFGNTSSCMTCHAMATLGATGSSLFFLKSTQPFEGFVGTPDPSWFYPASTGSPVTPIVYQTDFMWQLATETKARGDSCTPSR